ncbi:unnamed protein product [Closterium sp. Yama58-4]|nr:unnamed protein product [Closterium sp. Yama58-4]
MLNLLLETPLDSSQQDYAETACSSGRALCALINDILDLSKIEAEKLRLERIPLNLRAELDDVLALFVESAEENRAVELGAFVADDVPETLLGDPLRVKQILINLIGNALKFTTKGHVFIAVRLATPTDSTNHDAGAPPSLLSAASSTSSLSTPSSPSPPSSPSSPLSKESPARRPSLASCFTCANTCRGGKDAAEADGATAEVDGRSGAAGGDSETHDDGDTCGSNGTRVSNGASADAGTRDIDNSGADRGTIGGSRPVERASSDPGCLTLSGRPAVQSWCSWEAMREHMDLAAVGMPNRTCHACHGIVPPDQPVRLMVAVEDTGTYDDCTCDLTML